MKIQHENLYHSPLNKTVIIAGLGFFVDAFDLLLFNVLRIPSLKDLGFSGDQLMQTGEYLLSMQMLGMIIGGIISGIVGDRKGRVTVLFGSILLYSAANLANAWVQDIPTYAMIRFLSGLGLAGELGAGIALVGESMTIEKRGYGTVLVAVLGACGAIAAGLAGDLLPWRTSYILAGTAGLLLLFLRTTTLESSMYRQAAVKPKAARGSFRLLFSNAQRTVRYLSFILMGIPIWYCVGMLINLTPELAKHAGIEGIRPVICFILFQGGIAIGDLMSGIISQQIRNRKKVLLSFISLAVVAVVAFFVSLTVYPSRSLLLLASLLMGAGCGYMSIFVTTTAESFGTNLRVTVTATVTNFMRGAVTLLIPLRLYLQHSFELSLVNSLMIVGIVVFLPALLSMVYMKDTYGVSLDYQES
jgi:putative MFS transporter